MDAINWVDLPVHADGRIVLTRAELGIPGLRMFGKHHTQRAIPALQPHYHENCFELTYISKGSLHFSVDKRGYHISGGDLFIANPNEVHDTDAYPMSLHSMYWFQLDVSDPDNFLYLEKKAALRLISQLDGLPMRVIKLEEEAAHAMLTRVFVDFSSQSQRQRDMGATLLTYFLHFVIQSADRLRFSLEPDIGRAASYVLDHLDEELSMEQLAKVANLSVSRFKQKFKSQMGLPPREYVNAERMRAAEVLLQEGLTVMEAAMELGFSSSNYFAVVFRRHMGCSPREYLQRIRNG